MEVLSEVDKEYLLESIRDIPDFPKKGVSFKDITTLLKNREAFGFLMDHLEKRYKDSKLDFIAGIDSRGFIFGAPLADRLGIGFVPIRKAGKLPYTTIGEKYALEYGFDEVEIHIDAFEHNKEHKSRVLMIDDLIATGGTAAAAANLIKQADAICIETCFIINLKFLDGEDKIKDISPVYSVLDVH